MRLTKQLFEDYIFKIPFYPVFDNEDKFIFFQQPKTGFKSMLEAIGQHRHSWSKVQYKSGTVAKEKIRNYTNRDIDNLFSFTVVRNPWDRFVSGYHYYKGLHEWKPEVSIRVRESFEEFIMNTVSEHFSEPLNMYNCYMKIFDKNGKTVRGYWHHFAPMYPRVSKDGEIFVDYVAKIETLDEDWKYISNKIGVKYKEMPVVGASKRDRDYRKYYNEDTREIVCEMFKEDIEMFDYEF